MKPSNSGKSGSEARKIKNLGKPKKPATQATSFLGYRTLNLDSNTVPELIMQESQLRPFVALAQALLQKVYSLDAHTLMLTCEMLLPSSGNALIIITGDVDMHNKLLDVLTSHNNLA